MRIIQQKIRATLAWCLSTFAHTSTHTYSSDTLIHWRFVRATLILSVRSSMHHLPENRSSFRVWCVCAHPIMSNTHHSTYMLKTARPAKFAHTQIHIHKYYPETMFDSPNHCVVGVLRSTPYILCKLPLTACGHVPTFRPTIVCFHTLKWIGYATSVACVFRTYAGCVCGTCLSMCASSAVT